jgi:hypothetical protein
VPAEPRFAGRVVDLDGAPVPGLPVRFEAGTLGSIPGVEFFFVRHGEAPSFDTTDPGGAFAVSCHSLAAGRVIAEDAQFAPVAFWCVEPGARGRRNLPVAPRRTFHGRVEDEWGRPIESVQARFASTCPLPAAVDAAGLVRAEPAAYTDASGRFTLDAFRAPAELTLRKSGFAKSIVPVTEWSDDALVIVLSREERGFGDHVVRGQVLGPAGQPVLDAVVACGLRMAHVDVEGRFVLALKGLRGPPLVTAVAPGFCSAVVELDLREPQGEGAHPVVLQLSERALRIEGRAVDGAGRALAGVRVAIADPTPFGIDHQPWFAENFIRGLDRGLFIREVSSEDGSFCIDGLDRRDYRLCLWLPGTLVSTEVRVAAAADPVTVALRADAARRLRGRVVSAAGEPVAGAEVAPLATVVHATLQPGGSFTAPVRGTPVSTDPEGWFELPGIGEDCRLRVFGAGILPREFALPPPEAEPQSYRVDRLVRARLVQEAAPHAHDNLGVLDASGQCLLLRIPSAPLVETWVQRPALTELEAILEIPDSASEVLLFHGERPWARVPLSLRVGEPNTIDLPRCPEGGVDAHASRPPVVGRGGELVPARASGGRPGSSRDGGG